MSMKRTKGENIFNFFNVFIMLVVMLATLYPLLYVAFASLSNSDRLMMHDGILLKPLGLTLDAYKMTFKNPMILKGYLNTIFIVVAGVSINILLTSLGAYVLSCKKVLFGNVIMFFIIFTMFFSGGIIPFYFTIKDLHLYDSYWALIFPVAINTFNLIIMRTAFASMPDSIGESAKIDGAGHFTILFKIVLPLSLPTVAVLVLYYAVAHWNAWFNAMLFIKERTRMPLQLILREILIQNDTSMMSAGVSAIDQVSVGESIKYAVIIVATVPILFVYPFLQKYFVKGVMIGAIKG